MKPPRAAMLPSEFSRMLDTFVPGLLKCGVLVKLNASARNCCRSRYLIGKLRKIAMSEFTVPGPRRMLRPLVP
jgi:hypothetical protein